MSAHAVEAYEAAVVDACGFDAFIERRRADFRTQVFQACLDRMYTRLLPYVQAERARCETLPSSDAFACHQGTVSPKYMNFVTAFYVMLHNKVSWLQTDVGSITCAGQRNMDALLGKEAMTEAAQKAIAISRENTTFYLACP